MREVNNCSEPDALLVKKILNVCNESRWQSGDSDEGCAKKSAECRVRASIDLGSMELAPENIAWVVRARILNVKFFPTSDLRMVVAGNKFGDVGFWNVDSNDEDGDGIYSYRPHQNPVSAI